MRIETKEVRDTVKILDNLIKSYKENTKEEKRDWRTYEQRLGERIKTAIKELEPLIEEAITTIQIFHGDERGRKSELALKQKVELLLLKHLFGKSNREMSVMLVLFSLLSDIDVSYKTIERLYSDQEVLMVLHNMQVLMLNKKGIKNSNSSGDGTGYSLSVKKHYATEAQKLKDKLKSGTKKKKQFVYSFMLMDLDTRMYLGCGTSFKSEKQAFDKAISMVDPAITIRSIRLDRYFSAKKYAELFRRLYGRQIKLYLIPKKNATIKRSWKWKQMLHEFVNNTQDYLKEYFRRNQSESSISEDKRRFGWSIRQKREDRIYTVNLCTMVWHNLFWLG